MPYLTGRRLRFSVTITVLSTGGAVDPANLTLTLRHLQTKAMTAYTWPTSANIVHDGVGKFHCDVTPAAAGQWQYRWSCTGAVEDAVEGGFQMLRSQVVS